MFVNIKEIQERNNMGLNIWYQFINFIQEMHAGWFSLIWILIMGGALISIMNFFKIYNGTQTKFEKVSLVIISILLLAVLIFLTYVRK